ncbi:uncharacterized protein BO97DRAFT_443229 [Aspergillus homomorphus CBS 101889]|uniref:Stress-response A/B barrel domain-containing protein n=1 Tax=Aspergillus homomorphus (strain CBS 101889) TaxID=1450537 RepID=A0A395I0Z0_ASPHC|nr:hypothetical protein BO97DRAFT_443229 [Aspergillus homomorphus CBS 101889]RAL12204.1 hypothetical protein BO97DRAFT_443229 [Aspergillus homomorphus CBS 101889]
MPIYHIVLFRLKPGVTKAQLDHWSNVAKGMVGQIPGLRELHAGSPLAATAARAKGFDMGLVAILEKAEDVQVYAAHPAHLEVHKLREELCEDTLAYDLEF